LKGVPSKKRRRGKSPRTKRTPPTSLAAEKKKKGVGTPKCQQKRGKQSNKVEETLSRLEKKKERKKTPSGKKKWREKGGRKGLGHERFLI